MPTIWRYLLSHYFKVLFLALFSFIALLLVSRIQEIAHCAALGANLSFLFFFTLYQIPFILPIALPISCLISAMVLFQNLSHTHELTALRASGIPLSLIIAPILIVSSFLSIGNFYITSELSTVSRLATRQMIYDLSSVNPLILLQNAQIAKLKGGYVQMDPLKNGETAKNVIIALQSQPHHLHLLLADKLEMNQGELVGHHISIISSVPSLKGEFDHLMIENQKEMESSAPAFAKLLRNKGWRVANDYLKLSLLRVRLQALKKEMGKKGFFGNREVQKCYSDLIRRFSLGISPLTFTLLGVSFGMEISRNRTKKGIFATLTLATFSLISFFTAKAFGHCFLLAAPLFLLPHIVIIFSSLYFLRRIIQGIE